MGRCYAVSMDWVKRSSDFVTSWWTYIDFCLDADIQALVCKPLWTWIMVALFGIGAISIVWVAVKIISFRLQVRTAARAEAGRMRIAGEETMKAHIWEGDDALQKGDREEDVRRRIKEALIERKNENELRLPPVV